jgi:hypothetical protein
MHEYALTAIRSVSHRTQALVDVFGVGAVALAEDGQPAAVRTLEHLLDADVARCRERGGGQAVARSEAVLHALDHGFVHR